MPLTIEKLVELEERFADLAEHFAQNAKTYSWHDNESTNTASAAAACLDAALKARAQRMKEEDAESTKNLRAKKDSNTAISP